MDIWYNLEDIYRARGLKDVYKKYRVRVSRDHAKHLRHVTQHENRRGRPAITTYVDESGLRELAGDLLDQGLVIEASIPRMRLKDAAREFMLFPNQWHTKDLESPARHTDYDGFLAVAAASNRADELVEYDFDPLV